MRVFERESIQLLLGSLVALSFLMFSSNGFAAESIACKTNFGEKSFVIDHQTVAFNVESNSGRSISSVMGSLTQKSHKGFKKTLYVGGNKYLISIKNENKFDNSNDYLAVTTPRGHKMTYPINCQFIN